MTYLVDGETDTRDGPETPTAVSKGNVQKELLARVFNSSSSALAKCDLTHSSAVRGLCCMRYPYTRSNIFSTL